MNIAATIGMIGSDLPAYKALFEQVVATLGSQDQAALRKTYADAMAASDRAHAAAQEE